MRATPHIIITINAGVPVRSLLKKELGSSGVCCGRTLGCWCTGLSNGANRCCGHRHVDGILHIPAGGRVVLRLTALSPGRLNLHAQTFGGLLPTHEATCNRAKISSLRAGERSVAVGHIQRGGEVAHATRSPLLVNTSNPCRVIGAENSCNRIAAKFDIAFNRCMSAEGTEALSIE